MALNLLLKLNNISVYDYSSSLIRIIDGHPSLYWEFNNANKVSVDEYTGKITEEEDYSQVGYEIKIANNSNNIGTDFFIPNIYYSDYVESQIHSWVYNGPYLERGSVYYGQIKVFDEINRESEWVTFSFVYNSLPIVSDILISPSQPTIDDDLILSYSISGMYEDDDFSGTYIRWFKNGVYQKQFDSSEKISSQYLQIGDIWSSDIYPYDGYERGERVSSSYIKVVPSSVELSGVEIFPNNPNENDILEVIYSIDNISEGTDVFIRWFINDLLVQEYNDIKALKPRVSVGDTVRAEVKHPVEDFYHASSTVIIGYSDFVVSDIKVEGRENPLNVSSLMPLISWKNFIPSGKEVKYVSVKIGTFYEADNIYNNVFAFDRNSFSIPSGLLEKGRDYYISIAIGDTVNFDKYYSSHFRTTGRRWDLNVDNSQGWTMETLFKTDSASEEKDYQILRINDGSKFSEIRIYSYKIVFISSEKIEYLHDNTLLTSLTVAGRGNDIKIYLNKELVINGVGKFVQPTSSKKLEVGYPSSVGGDGFTVYYKYFVYTTEGYYLPHNSSEYANIQFHTFIEFDDHEIVALNTLSDGKKIFAINPDNKNINSSVYSIIAGDRIKCGTTNRTFAPINKINCSPDKKINICAHSKGITRIKGYDIMGRYNDELLFVNNDGTIVSVYPDQLGWELFQNTTFPAAFFNEDGLNINTIG